MHRQVTSAGSVHRKTTSLVLVLLFGCGGRAEVEVQTTSVSSSGGNASIGGAAAAGMSPSSSSGTSADGGSDDATTGGQASGDAGALQTGTAGGAGTTGGADVGGTPTPIEVVTCNEFVPLWQSRASASTSTCDFCLEFGTCDFPRDGDCAAGTDCVDRHCSTITDGTALCACIENCFSVALTSCDQRWSTFMLCASSACANACE